MASCSMFRPRIRHFSTRTRCTTALFFIVCGLLVVAQAHGQVSAGLAEPDDGPGPGPLTAMAACGACTEVERDVVFGVPHDFYLSAPRVFRSGHGGYFHKEGVCDCFVVDIWMYFNSNKIPPNGDPSEVRVTANAYDLPSSKDSVMIRPGTEADCNSYYRVVRMWEKKEGTDTWVEVKKQEDRGEWNGVSCDVPGVTYVEVSPSTTNKARTLRVAVKVLERDSAQQAQVRVLLPGPG